MSPCFPRGSRPAVTFRAYKSPRDVRRGDVVIVRIETQGQIKDVAWRVIGLPSEHVVLDETMVTVNGRPLDKVSMGNAGQWMFFAESSEAVRYCVSYHVGGRRDQLARCDVTVPRDQFFVLGDNRDKSYDSRSIGPIPFTGILARFDDSSCTCPGTR